MNQGDGWIVDAVGRIQEESIIAGIPQYTPDNSFTGGSISSLLSGTNMVVDAFDRLRDGPLGQWARQDQTAGFIPDSMVSEDAPRSESYQRMGFGNKRKAIGPPSSNGGSGAPPPGGTRDGSQIPSGGPPLTGGGPLSCFCRKGMALKYIDRETNFTQIISATNPPNFPLVSNVTGVYGPVFWPNYPAQGTDVNQRVGNTFRLHSHICRLNLIVSPGQSNKIYGCAPHIRVIMLFDKQANGAVPASAGEILNIQAPNTTPSITAMYNYNNKERFEILYDNTFRLGFVGTTGNSVAFTTEWANQCSLNTILKLCIPLKNRKVVMNGTAGNIANVNTGSLLKLILLENSDQACILSYNSRLIFVDE